MEAALNELAERIRAAAAQRQPLRIRGGGTKDFYGNPPRGETLDPRGWRGVVSYEPTELVVTARCGTPLAELKSALAERGQMLAFEPPHFANMPNSDASVGGCVAAGLAGPRRMAVVGGGAVRDSVLGARLMNAKGEVLRFGGVVMKNVAGYDIARLLAGSLGTLGLIVEVSLKVQPKPVAEATLRFDLDEAAALEQINAWCGKPLPISASAWRNGQLFVRLSGTAAGVRAAAATLGGERIDAPEAGDAAIWVMLREQTEPFFALEGPLWRLSVPPTTPPLDLGTTIIEWGGAQRWVHSTAPAAAIRARAKSVGGHATLFRGYDKDNGAFQPLEPALATIHRRLKQQFDPDGIFNPGRLYPDW